MDVQREGAVKLPSSWSTEPTTLHSRRLSWSSTRDTADSGPSTSVPSLYDLELASTEKESTTVLAVHSIPRPQSTPSSLTAKHNLQASHATISYAAARTTLPLHSLPVYGHDLAFLLLVCTAQLLSLGGLNQTVAPLLILAEHFDVQDYGTLSWFSAAYSLTVGTFIMPAGRLGDMYGHRRLYMIGWAWFCVCSAAAGVCFRANVIAFSLCRALQGIGPALLVPNAIALIARRYPAGPRRSMALACFGAAGPIGATLGAVFTAILAELVWWPACFFALAGVCALLLPLTAVIIPRDDAGASSSDAKTFDYLGCTTGVTGLLLFNYALNQAPLVGWRAPDCIVATALGLLLLFAFVFIESKYAKHPLIPLRKMQTEVALILGCIAAGWGSHGIWAYYLYLFLEQVKHRDALLTALQTAPVALTGVPFAFSTIWLLRRIDVSWIMLIAMSFFVLGALLLATVPLSQTYFGQTFISIILMPGAMNLSFPAATIMISASLPREEQGIAASLVATVLNYSISCGLGFAGSIARYSDPKILESHGFRGLPPTLLDNRPELDAARLECLKKPWWFAVALGAAGILIASYSTMRQKLGWR